MSKSHLYAKEVKEKLDKARNITILTHLNPDADTIGTGLGIFNILSKDKTKRIEIVNASNMLAKHLDFLPAYSKIKNKMDFEDSLIISCDCANIDRLGFELKGREIINIDHHKSNELYGDINIVMPEYASASQVAYELFKELTPIDLNSATCFYTALFSDTRHFTTSSVDENVFKFATELVTLGVNPANVAKNCTQRKSLSSIRILNKALQNLELSCDAQLATLFVTYEDILSTGATMPDVDGIVDYGKSLATVKISVFYMELEDSVRVSLRSKGIDVSSLAKKMGGGGHKVAAGFICEKRDLHEIIDILTKIIKESSLFD
ncbi:FIG146085: 3'-to-5' oligoribonuclease A, Bacillus type [hydrothermal vent metagenome]|uniref:FIG146085: 3'-to-5' oligoribonuclease A, Bacillus type n=1 Tax=hydrothermal vent metagenome TaxID=652676 RepID=A0A1W1EED6_9ZZZZ